MLPVSMLTIMLQHLSKWWKVHKVWGWLTFLTFFKPFKVTFGLVNAEMLGWASINFPVGWALRARACLVTEPFVAGKCFLACQCTRFAYELSIRNEFSPCFPFSHGTVHQCYHLKCCLAQCCYVRTGNFSCFGSLLNDFCGLFLSHNALVWYKVFLKEL